jgi:hypothetical protein
MHYEAVSDKNPIFAALAPVAVQVKNKRRKATPDNPFVQLEKQISKSIESTLDLWGEWRDAMIERTFMTVYGSPLVQNIAGLGAREGSPREHPGVSPEHIAFVRRRVDELRKLVQCGGLREASIRVMVYIAQAQGGIDERSFNLIRQLRAQQEHSLSLAAFKKLVREQAMVMVVDPEGAVDAIPSLLSHHSATEIEAALKFVTRVAMASGSLNAEGKKRLAQVARFYDLAVQQSSQIKQDDGFTSVNLRRPLLTEPSNDATSRARQSATSKTVAKKASAKKVIAKKVSAKPAAVKKAITKTTASKKVLLKPATKTVAKRAKKASA